MDYLHLGRPFVLGNFQLICKSYLHLNWFNRKFRLNGKCLWLCFVSVLFHNFGWANQHCYTWDFFVQELFHGRAIYYCLIIIPECPSRKEECYYNNIIITCKTTEMLKMARFCQQLVTCYPVDCSLTID